MLWIALRIRFTHYLAAQDLKRAIRKARPSQMGSLSTAYGSFVCPYRAAGRPDEGHPASSHRLASSGVCTPGKAGT